MRMVFATLFVCMIAFSSCYTPRYAYTPSAHNVPMITEKGDGKIGASYSTSISGDRVINDEDVNNNVNGVDIQGAYAISNHWALQASHMQRWERTNTDYDSSRVKYHKQLSEFGVGYYFPMNSNRNAWFQVFGGGGFGKFDFTDNSIYGSFIHQADVLKFYVQPAFYFRTKGSFSVAVSVRGSIVKFNSVRTNYSEADLQDFNLTYLDDKAKFFLEPALVGSFGFKNVPGLRFEFQGGFSVLTAERPFDYHTQNFSIGSYLDFGSLRKGTNRR